MAEVAITGLSDAKDVEGLREKHRNIPDTLNYPDKVEDAVND